MTDKVQKIREEVERLMYGFNLEADIASCEDAETEELANIKYQLCKKILDYIDKVQEETVSEELTDEIKLWLKQWSENEMEWSREDIWDTAEHFANWQKQQIMKDAVLCGVDGWFINNKRNCRKNGRFHKYYVSTITHDKPLPMENGKDYRLITIKED